jgi:hypothetical protein
LQSIDALRCNFISQQNTQLMEQHMSGMIGGSLSTVPDGWVIDFEKAELKHMPFQDGVYLVVKGRCPGKGFDVRLAPLVYNETRPDYWGIEVAMFTAGSNAEAADDNAMFERSVPLAGITGTRGVTVIGANQELRIDIDGEAF